MCSVTLFDLEEAPAEGGAQLLGSHQGVPDGPPHMATICNNAVAGLFPLYLRAQTVLSNDSCPVSRWAVGKDGDQAMGN